MIVLLVCSEGLGWVGFLMLSLFFFGWFCGWTLIFLLIRFLRVSLLFVPPRIAFSTSAHSLPYDDDADEEKLV